MDAGVHTILCRPTIDYRLLIATTNHISPNALKTMAAQTIPVGVLRLCDLKKSEAPWPASLDQLKAVKRETKKPREHQQTAIDKTIAGFGDHDRGQLIMACFDKPWVPGTESVSTAASGG